jgi:hypothetical protein
MPTPITPPLTPEQEACVNSSEPCPYGCDCGCDSGYYECSHPDADEVEELRNMPTHIKVNQTWR